MKLYKDEILKEIKGYEGKYLISNYGRVYSLISHHWLTPTRNKHGNNIRYYVNLGRGTNNRFYVHQLVAKHFIDNPEGYNEIDHIDTDPSNNHVNNLRWVTHAQNMSNEKTQENVSNNGALALEIKNTQTGKTYWGYISAAEAENVSRQTIINHCNNKVKNPRFQLTGRKKDIKRNKIFEKSIDN